MSFSAQKNANADDTKLAGLDGDDISTNQEAIPVPYHTGYAPQTVKWITKALNVKIEDVTAETGKNSRSTVARDYFADIAGVCCHGVVGYLKKVVINQNVVWEGLLSRDGSGAGSKFKTITIVGWGRMTIYWGTEDQDPDPLLTSAVLPNPAYVETYNESTGAYENNGEDPYLPAISHPAYRGLCYVVFQKLLFGRETTSSPTVILELGRMGDCPLFDYPETDEGVSPLIPAYELLTNKRFGFGLDPDEVIDSASWIATAAAIQPGETAFIGRQSSNLSCQISKATAIKELFAELSSYYDGWFRLNAGLIEAGFYPHAAPADESGLLVLDPQDFIRGQDPDVSFEGWSATFNQINVKGSDRARMFKDSPQPYQSLYNLRVTGEIRTVNLTKPWCITADNTKLLATDFGKIQSVPFASGTLYARAERVIDLLPGDVFRLTYAPLSIDFLCRCTGMTMPDSNGGVTQVAFEQERGVMPTPAGEVTDDPPAPPQLPATSAGMAKVVELHPEFTGTQDTTVAILVAKPHQSALGYFTKFARVTPNYDDLSEGAFFAQHARLDTAYSSVASGTMTLTIGGIDVQELVSQTDDQRDDDTLLMFMNNEIFSIGAVTPLGGNQYTVTVLRHRANTVVQSHAQYAQGFIIERAKLNTAMSANFVSAATGYFKILPFTAIDTVPDSDGLVVSLAFRDRAADKPVITWDTAAATSGDIGTAMDFTGTITDANSDLIQVAVVAQRIVSGVALGEIVAVSSTIDPTGSYAFKAKFVFMQAGTYRITCRAMDSRNNSDGYAEKKYPNNSTPTDITITGALGGGLVQLNGVNKTYYQGTAPIGTLVVGDLWFDTSNGYKLTRWNGSSWVTATRVVSATDFGTGVKPVEIFASLPAAGNAGRVVFLTADFKLYRDTGSVWTKATDGGDITANTILTGSIAAGQITATLVGTNTIITNSANIANATITSAHIVSIDAGLINAGTVNVALTLTAVAITGGSLDIGSGANRVRITTSGTQFGDTSGSTPNILIGDSGGNPAMLFRNGTSLAGAIGIGPFGMYISGIPTTSQLSSFLSVSSQSVVANSSSNPRTTDAPLYSSGGTWLASSVDIRGQAFGYIGTAGAPAFCARYDDADTGIYSDEADKLKFSAGGTQIFRIVNSGGTLSFLMESGVVLRVGNTRQSITSETLQYYVTALDSSGNAIKLAVVA